MSLSEASLQGHSRKVTESLKRRLKQWQKNVMEVVSENSVWKGMFLRNAWNQPVKNCNGSRQADCSMHIDHWQRRHGHPILNAVSLAHQDLRKMRNADDAVIACDRTDGVFQVEQCRSIYTLVYKYTQLVLDSHEHLKPMKLREQRSYVVILLLTNCEACSSVDYRLQSVQIAAWLTYECDIVRQRLRILYYWSEQLSKLANSKGAASRCVCMLRCDASRKWTVVELRCKNRCMRAMKWSVKWEYKMWWRSRALLIVTCSPSAQDTQRVNTTLQRTLSATLHVVENTAIDPITSRIVGFWCLLYYG